MTLRDAEWVNRFLSETPGDDREGGQPRQVPNACWSKVNPTNVPKPTLRLWSKEIASELGISEGDESILGGNERFYTQASSRSMHPAAKNAQRSDPDRISLSKP